MALENSECKVSEHQTKLLKEDEKANTKEVAPKETINKLKEIINYLETRPHFDPAQTHIG